jgi:hypothetical protein
VTQSSDTLEQTILAEADGTRTWTVWAASREELLERVTLIFAERIHDDDEVHIAYNAMQTGWRAFIAPSRTRLQRRQQARRR